MTLTEGHHVAPDQLELRAYRAMGQWHAQVLVRTHVGGEWYTRYGERGYWQEETVDWEEILQHLDGLVERLVLDGKRRRASAAGVSRSGDVDTVSESGETV